VFKYKYYEQLETHVLFSKLRCKLIEALLVQVVAQSRVTGSAKYEVGQISTQTLRLVSAYVPLHLGTQVLV